MLLNLPDRSDGKGIRSTVRRRGSGLHWIDAVAMFFGITVGIIGIIFSMSNPTGEIDAPPSVLAFIFGIVALLAAFGDILMFLA